MRAILTANRSYTPLALYPLRTELIHSSEVLREAGGLTERAEPRSATLIREGQGPGGFDLRGATKHHGCALQNIGVRQGHQSSDPREIRVVTTA